MKRILSKLILPLLALVFLFSCQTPAVPGGTRKKMPDLTGDNALEGPMPFQPAAASPGPEAFAFHTSNIDLETGGSVRGFVYVPLPDASNDSAAISLLHSFRLMALPMLNTWAKQQDQGVAIDFSSHNGTPMHRSDYVLEKAGGFAIPVVVFWDQASAARVDELRSLAGELPGTTFTVTNR